MWICPECGAYFVQRNLSHSCGKFSVQDFLEGKTQRSVDLFWYFLSCWERIGPFRVHPVKTSVSLLVEVRFCRINRLTKSGIVCHLWLKQKLDSHKFVKVELLGKEDYLHHFRLTDETFIDAEFEEYMKMAYMIGQRKDSFRDSCRRSLLIDTK